MNTLDGDGLDPRAAVLRGWCVDRPHQVAAALSAIDAADRAAGIQRIRERGPVDCPACGHWDHPDKACTWRNVEDEPGECPCIGQDPVLVPPGTNPLTEWIDRVGGGKIQAFRVTIETLYADQARVVFPIHAKTLPELIQALAWTNDAVQTLREYGAVEPGVER